MVIVVHIFVIVPEEKFRESFVYLFFTIYYLLLLKGEQSMFRLFVSTASFLAVVTITLLAFFLKINGHTTLEISERLPVLLAPSNYVYIILIVIMIFIALWIIKYWHSRKDNFGLSNIQTILFLVSCVLQVASILTWHHLQYTISIFTLVLLLFSLAALYFTYPLSDKDNLIRIPISICFAWVTCTLMFNLSFVLTLHEWHGFGLSNQLWAVIVMTLGSAVALHFRFHFFDKVYPVVFIWAYIGVAFHNGFDELLVSTAALFLSGVMLVGILFIKKNPDSQK